jgi:hypothetical protein
VLVSSLSACGSSMPGQSGAQATPPVAGKLPDSVQIRLDELNPAKEAAPVVTLRVLAQTQQLYQTMLALPPMPQQIACPAVAGPRYELTFLRGTQTQVRAVADRGGCGTVTIAGEKQDRLASKAFWDQLNQAIYAATPIAKPQALAIQHTLQGNQPVRTARIADSASAQRLYNAILALPQAAEDSCNDTHYPEYQLVFQTSNQAIPAVISQRCKTISLNGNNQSRSGLYTQSAQFQQLFAQTLAGATFAPAHPDQLVQTLNAEGSESHGQVTDTQLMQQLYAKIFTLQPGTVGPDCPSNADKVAGKARWYDLDFTQWGLPIMSLTVYEGSCKLVQPSPGLATSQTLLGDAAFWDLVHRAARG